MGGFGREARDAMQARAEHLADEGLARRQSQRIILQRDLLNTLRCRELDASPSSSRPKPGSRTSRPRLGSMSRASIASA